MMILVVRLLVLLFIATPYLSFAKNEHKTSPKEKASEKLATYLRDSGFVKSLSRETHFYHYTSRPIDDVYEYARRRAQDFLDPLAQEKAPDTANLYGLYLAPDPIATRGYGGDEWSLMRLILEPQTRFLDLGKNTSQQWGFFQFPNEIKTSLEEAQCHLVNLSNPSVEPRPKDLFLKNYDQDCRDIVESVLKSLSIQALFYDFGGAQIHGCREQRRQVAVVLVDESPIQVGHLRVFDYQTTWLRDDPEHQALAWMYYQSFSQNNPRINENQKMNFFKGLNSTSLEQGDKPSDEWFRDSIYACQYHWDEDYLPGEK